MPILNNETGVGRDFGEATLFARRMINQRRWKRVVRCCRDHWHFGCLSAFVLFPARLQSGPGRCSKPLLTISARSLPGRKPHSHFATVRQVLASPFGITSGLVVVHASNGQLGPLRLCRLESTVFVSLDPRVPRSPVSCIAVVQKLAYSSFVTSCLSLWKALICTL